MALAVGHLGPPPASAPHPLTAGFTSGNGKPGSHPGSGKRRPGGSPGPRALSAFGVPVRPARPGPGDVAAAQVTEWVMVAV